MLKKFILLVTALAVMAVSAVAMAAPTQGKQQSIIDAARTEVPAAAVMYGYKEDGDKTVLNFRDNDNYLEYEVEVITATAKVKEVEIKGSNIAGSTTIVKTAEDIKAIVLEAYPDAQNIVIETEKEGNNTYYEAKFSTPKYKKVEAKLNPVSGVFAEREVELY